MPAGTPPEGIGAPGAQPKGLAAVAAASEAGAVGGSRSSAPTISELSLPSPYA
jgi:hypothetical protein